MIEIGNRRVPKARGEAGIALVLAIMALMLLTFLGLTLATTTSTELQIATNYRWSQQAFYNAEAGLEAAKAILRSTPPGTSWSVVLPNLRGGNWQSTPPSAAPGTAGLPTPPAGMPATDDWGQPLRNFENQGCDDRGGRVGYGVILNDTASAVPQGVMQNKTVLFGQRLNGAATVWVRRDVIVGVDGFVRDDPADVALIITAEGIAPYTDGSSSMAFARANQAVRVIESAVLRAQGGSDPCEAYRAQTGGGVSGTNFGVCTGVTLECGAGAAAGEDEQDLLADSIGNATRQRRSTEGEFLGRATGNEGTFGSLQQAPGLCVE
jgi:Tfp pilus assembly protein PilX